MKHSIVCLSALLAMGSAHARIIIPDLSDAFSATTTLPSVKPDLIKECANATEKFKANCVVYTTTGVALSISSVALLKEEVKHVEPDVYAYLAGEEMSLALEEVVNEARKQSPELQNSNDEEVVSLLVSALQ